MLLRQIMMTKRLKIFTRTYRKLLMMRPTKISKSFSVIGMPRSVKTLTTIGQKSKAYIAMKVPMTEGYASLNLPATTAW